MPGKFLTAADLGGSSAEVEGAEWKTVLVDGRTGRPVVPNGSLGFRHTDSGMGRWNLDLDGVAPRLTMYRDPLAEEAGAVPVEVLLPRFDTPDGHGEVLHRGVPTRRVAGHLVTTVFDLVLAQYGVGRDGLPGTLAGRLRRRVGALHAGLAGALHVGRCRRLHPGGARDGPQRRAVAAAAR